MRTSKNLLLLCLLAGLVASCASGPHYGSKKKKRKDCDCPKWSMASPAPTAPNEAPCALPEQPAAHTHASRN